jgi:hypothetical protein
MNSISYVCRVCLKALCSKTVGCLPHANNYNRTPKNRQLILIFTFHLLLKTYYRHL